MIWNPDTKGVSRRLGEMASKGNVVLLSFVVYGVEPTAAYNVKLNEIYNANRDSGLDIYQVSVDPDEMAWKNSAPNLPWTSVYASPVSDRGDYCKIQCCGSAYDIHNRP